MWMLYNGPNCGHFVALILFTLWTAIPMKSRSNNWDPVNEIEVVINVIIKYKTDLYIGPPNYILLKPQRIGFKIYHSKIWMINKKINDLQVNTFKLSVLFKLQKQYLVENVKVCLKTWKVLKTVLKCSDGFRYLRSVSIFIGKRMLAILKTIGSFFIVTQLEQSFCRSACILGPQTTFIMSMTI